MSTPVKDRALTAYARAAHVHADVLRSGRRLMLDADDDGLCIDLPSHRDLGDVEQIDAVRVLIARWHRKRAVERAEWERDARRRALGLGAAHAREIEERIAMSRSRR